MKKSLKRIRALKEIFCRAWQSAKDFEKACDIVEQIMEESRKLRKIDCKKYVEAPSIARWWKEHDDRTNRKEKQ